MIKTLDKKNIPANVLSIAKEISNLDGVKEVVCFPDIHLKEKYTNLGYRIDIPSSLAILTENCLYPQFRSRGINCGMSLIKTNLFYKDSLVPELKKILLNFKKGISISSKEFRNICLEGSEVIREKFGLSVGAVFGKEFKFSEQERAQFDYSGINRDWRKGSFRLKRKLGAHFGGNHFLEFQKVDNIFNQKKADEWGIKKGQIYILYHTAGESLDSILEQKILKETIYQPNFIKLEKSSPNFQIILKAVKFLMNYGFAYRLATFAMLNSLLQVDYFTDQYHNGIEALDPDNTLFLYRHNVNKVSKNAPVLLSGTSELKSYVNAGEQGAENFLWSSDHGYGGLNLPAVYLLSLFEKHNISTKVFSLMPIINLKFI